MDDRLTRPRSSDEAGVVGQVAFVRLDAARGQGLGRFVGSRHAQHGVSVADQLLRHGRANKSGRPGEEYAHGCSLNECRPAVSATARAS